MIRARQKVQKRDQGGLAKGETILMIMIIEELISTINNNINILIN